MLDLLQKVHQQVTADIVKNKWPMPIPDEEQLSAKEKAKIQETWKNLREDIDKPPAQQVGKVIISRTKPLDQPKLTNAQLEQFRYETLSNFGS